MRAAPSRLEGRLFAVRAGAGRPADTPSEVANPRIFNIVHGRAKDAVAGRPAAAFQVGLGESQILNAQDFLQGVRRLIVGEYRPLGGPQWMNTVTAVRIERDSLGERSVP